MNILFLFSSLPHLSKENQLYAALVNEFRKQGHHVLVSSRGEDVAKSEVVEENGIKVLRVKSHPFTGVSNPIKKALAYQEYVLKQRYFVKKYFGKEKIDLIFSHSLPPELAFVIGSLKKHFNCKFYLHQSDFTWQDAVAFGYFSKKNPVALYYQYWEKKAFEIADFIGCPTKGTELFIRKEYPYLNEKKFCILPYCQRNVTINKDNSILAKYGLEDKFVCVYGGSVGAAQCIERLVDLAETVKETPDIHFVLLGRGEYLPVIQKMVNEKCLENFHFIDFMPQEDYLRFLSVCDIGMIILNEKTGSPNFPSKSLSYFCLGVPILAALDYVTDFGTLLEERHAGLWAHSDDITSLKEKLLLYYNSPELREQAHVAGRQFYDECLTPEKVYQSIIETI